MTDPARPKVLVVDDDLALAETIADGLVEHGYDATGVGSSREALRELESVEYEAVVTDLRMPGVDGLDLLAQARHLAPQRPVIVMTAYSAVESAIESIRQGAYHYLTKPFKVEELVLFLERALDEARLRQEAATLKRALHEQTGVPGLVSRSAAMRELVDVGLRIADASNPILIVGETGTGKGVLARAIHAAASRGQRAFVTVNCAAVPEHLLESELFGHVKGAFTGATSGRRGLFEQASNGTLFLDEVGDMPLALQAKLLDAIERGVIRAVGSDRERPASARIVAATHRDLRARVRAGTFREDLLFRLDVLRLEIPPLRERPEDVPALLAHFLAQAHSRHPHSPVQRMGRDAFERLLAHTWPGNVRELENTVERAVLLGRGSEVGVSDLPASIASPDAARAPRFEGPVLPLEELCRRYARWAIAQLGGRKMLTAEKLDIDRKTLARLLADDEGKALARFLDDRAGEASEAGEPQETAETNRPLGEVAKRS
jgi:two-component system response regulator HydG